MKLWHMLDLAYALVSGDHERLLGTPGAYYVDRVEIWGEPPAGSSEYHIRDLRDQTALLALRAPHLGRPVLLRLKFQEFRKKKIGPKKPIGENVMELTGTVMTPDGRTVLGQTALTLSKDSIVDKGLHGGLSLATSENEAQRILDTEVASAMLERVYGTEDWDKWMHNPY